MNVVVIGTGYVGLNTAVMLSYLHHNVIGIDVDENKVNILNKGIPTISENGLNKLLPFCRENRNLRFSIDYRDVKLADVIFITVGTPSNKDGSCNLSYIYSVVDRLIESFNECNCNEKEIKDRVIVIKSTVPIGVNKEVEHKIKENVKIKEIRDKLYFASNPEFLREGSALYDSFYPDRIVIGSENDRSFSIMERLYKDLINREFNVGEFIDCNRNSREIRDKDKVEVVKTDILSAEMIKYASNCFLAMKISYANEISNLARKLGANMIDISRGMGLDKRISPYFLNHGLGWGGSCFPKDSLALVSIARENEVPLKLVQSSVDVNNHRIQDLIEIIKNSDRENLESLENKRICLFGITFKPNTDDVRNSVPVELARELIKRKASVVINDPCGLQNARSIYKNEGFEFEDDVYKAVENADILIISTEWRDYYNLDYEKISNVMRNKVIFDARNMLYNKRNEIEKYFKYLHF